MLCIGAAIAIIDILVVMYIHAMDRESEKREKK